MGDQDFKIPKWVDETFLLKVLRSKFPSKQDVQVHNVTVEVATNKGDGFACEMFRLVVDSSLGTFPLILKKPHDSAERYAMLKEYDVYNREISFYTEYHPALKEILESVAEFEEFAPELFYADRESELLVLRDLREGGYKSGDRVKRVPRAEAYILLRKLAKFHAASLILNKNLEGQLEKLRLKVFDGSFCDITCCYIRAMIEDMGSWGSDYESIIPKLEANVKQYAEQTRQNVFSKRGLNLMVHADPWYNNMMFRSGSSPDAILIDFQTAGWASLAIDLIYFMVTSLSPEDFAEREEFIAFYHGHLERVLQKLKWEKVPTLADVQQEFKDRFYHAMYSTVAKAMTAFKPSQQTIETMFTNYAEKMRNPVIIKELQMAVKLMDLYGVLDVKLE